MARQRQDSALALTPPPSPPPRSPKKAPPTLKKSKPAVRRSTTPTPSSKRPCAGAASDSMSCAAGTDSGTGLLVPSSSIPTAGIATELRQRIQALAQELQDLILDCVVAVDLPRDVYPMRPGGKPLPIGLRLNKKLRLSTAEEYYGQQRSFHLVYDIRVDDDEGPTNIKVRKWLSSLSLEHQFLIGEVHFHPNYTAQVAALGPISFWGVQFRLKALRSSLQPSLKNAIILLDWYCSEQCKTMDIMPSGSAISGSRRRMSFSG